MQEGWALGCIIQREEEKIQGARDVWIPGPGVERERDGFGMKLTMLKSLL